MFSGAWHDIRAVICYAPRLYGSAKAERLFEAMPQLADPAQPGEEFHQAVVVMPTRGPSSFAVTFAARLSLPKVVRLGELIMPSLRAKLSFRFGRQSTGTCSCGRRALVLSLIHI